jgi:hypothetical protein
MTERRSDTDTGTPAGGEAKPGRGERLSVALRANLARRKVQARARKGTLDPPGGGMAISPAPETGKVIGTKLL